MSSDSKGAVKLNESFDTQDATAVSDKTAPPVQGGTAVIPLAVASKSGNGASSRKRSKRTQKIFNSPFLDWRVLVILIGLALAVGLTVGLVMKKKNANKSAPTAITTSNSGIGEQPGTSDSTGIVPSHPTMEPSVELPEVENDSAPLTTESTEPPMEDNVEQSPIPGNTVVDDCQQVRPENLSATAIEFSMKLTTGTLLNEMLDDQEFGEGLLDTTFRHLYEEMNALPQINGMSLNVKYIGACQMGIATCKTIQATFEGQVQLFDDGSSGLAIDNEDIQGAIRRSFSDSGLVAWAMLLIEAGIDVTSVTVFQSCIEVGAYIEGSDGTLAAPIVPEPDWGEVVVRNSEKEGTVSFALDRFVMTLAQASSSSSIGVEELIYVTFGHLYEVLQQVNNFVGLRLRVEVHRQVRHLRKLQGVSTTDAVFTGRIRLRDDPTSPPNLDEIQAMLYAALSGTNLEAWLTAAKEGGLDVASVAVFDESNAIIGSSDISIRSNTPGL